MHLILQPGHVPETMFYLKLLAIIEFISNANSFSILLDIFIYFTYNI